MKHVLLITNEVFTPYAKNEVFGWPVDEAKDLVAKSEGKVRLYDESKDSDHLKAMNGQAQVVEQSSAVEVVAVDPKTFEEKASGKGKAASSDESNNSDEDKKAK